MWEKMNIKTIKILTTNAITLQWSDIKDFMLYIDHAEGNVDEKNIDKWLHLTYSYVFPRTYNVYQAYRLHAKRQDF